MDPVSYDDGLYRPDTWEDTTAAPVEESTVADWGAEETTSTPDATTTEVAWSPTTTSTTTTSSARTTSSSSMSAAAATTDPATPPPSTFTPSSQVAVSASPSSSSSSSFASSTSVSSSASAAIASATSNSLSAQAADTSGPSFVSMKQWLIPVIVVAPILIGILVLGCLHGKCWGKRRQRVVEEGGDGGGWFGGVGSLGRRRQARDEEGGLVERKYAGDDADLDEFDEKAAYAPTVQRRWSTMLRSGLGRGLSYSSSIAPTRRQKPPPVPFVAVSRPSIDEPFLPPSQSHYDQAFGASPSRDPPRAGAWNYGGQPEGTRLKQSSNTMLTSGWGLGGAGNYKARSTSSRGSSVRSRLSDRLFGEGNRGIIEEPPSPSCYSHADGAYAGLEGEDDGDPEMREEELNEYLAEGRTGDGHLAQRYLGGERELGMRRAPPQQQQQRVEDLVKQRYIARHEAVPSSPSYDQLVHQMGIADLPTPPRQSHVSPTKTSVGSSLLRPSTSSATPPPAKLLFSYDSPPVHSTYQPQQLVSPELAPGSPRGPLPRPPQQQPNFGAPPPRQQQPFNGGRPLYPAAQPDIFFSTTSQPPFGAPVPQSAGSMPLRQSFGGEGGAGAMRSSENGPSFTGGMQNPAFAQHGVEQQQQGNGIPQQRAISPTKDSAAKLRKPNPNPAPRLPVMQPTAPTTQYQPHVHQGNPTREWERAEVAQQPPQKHQPPQQDPAPAFNPVFAESPALPPLQHPSRVRNAIHQLEAASASASASTSPPASPTRPATTTAPSPYKAINARTTYSRPIKSGEDDSDDERSSESGERLHRTRTGDSQHAQRDRPLSSDPRRLSLMLRRPSQGAGLGRPVVEE